MKLEDIAKYNTRIQLLGIGNNALLPCKIKLEDDKVFADVPSLTKSIPYGTLTRIYATSRHCAGETFTINSTPASSTTIQLNPGTWKSYDEEFSTVGSLVNYTQKSPDWVGDDFKECLKDVNRSRP
jgi:hypothetical protein